ncbi:MAG: hypothetical protein P4L84_28015 [Isosphaeraceae bacterium]|nr:hypothetical protein [Isosphaeraceae bacterium]
MLMGRRIVQLVSLMLTAGLSVPLALALAQPPEPAPVVPAPAADTKKESTDAELPPLVPIEGAEPSPVPALPPPQEKDLLDKVIVGDAPPAKPKAKKSNVLPGPKSLTLPTPKPAARPAKVAEGAPRPDPAGVTLAGGQGEMPELPVAAKDSAAPPGSDVTPLPRMPRSGAAGDEPAPLPIAPADARDMPDAARSVKTPAGSEPGHSPRDAVDDAAALDAQLRQSQAPTGAPAAETNPLPPALDPSGKAGTPVANPNPNAGADGVESFVLPADQLPLGRQAVGLTVDVVSPQFLNLNQEASLKVVVKNTGSTDAKGVVVRDELPQGLTFQSSQPIAQVAAGSSLLVWRLGTVAAGSERIILLRVIPKKVGAFEHAATVTMQAGGKARTLVREPKLKVEQTVSTAKVLKGQQVEFRIAITNTGNGPAHRVIVRAKLTPGLRHESGEPNEENLFEQELELLEPGQRVALDPLVTDAIAGGQQTCIVEAKSPDVTTALDEARTTQVVSVVEPRLAMTVAGPDKRFTDTIARYDVTLANPGTATARKIRVLVSLPVDGRLLVVPSGAQFDRASRKLVWNVVQLDPAEKTTFSFQVRMGSSGRYEVAVEGRADGGLHVEGLKSTTVEGLADLDLEVTEKRRVVDVGDTAVFQVKITNRGTKEATHLLIRGFLSNNLLAKEVDVENNGDVQFNDKTGEVVFPQIERLGSGKETTLSVKVQALPKPGLATFRVELMHDDLGNGKIEDMGSFRVTPARTAEK